MKIKLDKIQNIILVALVLAVFILIIFGNPLRVADELWNFQNLCKMSNGLKIYTDANVIITPIFFYIAHIILSIFGTNILVFRVYNLLIYIAFFSIVYRIFKNLKIPNQFILAYIILVIEFIFQVIGAGANYNILAIVFWLIGLNLYITKKNNNVNQGILIFLIFFTKQNLGALYAITIIIYELYKNKLSKKFIIDQFKKFFFFLIPTAVLALFMYIDGNLFDFINFAFGGLFDFGKNNALLPESGYHPLIFVLAICLYIFIIIKRDFFKEVINKECFENLTLIFIFAIGMNFVIFPIVNIAHLIMALPLYLIFLFYLFHILIVESLFGDKKYEKNIKWFCIVILFILLIRIFANMLFEDDATFIKDKDSNFFGTYVYDSILEKSAEVEQYILEQNSNGIDVMILSYDAAFPMINLKQNHGVYDLLFNGNMGYNGIEKTKQDIIDRKNTQFLLVTEEEDLFWQESKEIREFIMENLNSIGEINNYTIYSNN